MRQSHDRMFCQHTKTFGNTSGKIGARFVSVKSTLRYVFISNKKVHIEQYADVTAPLEYTRKHVTCANQFNNKHGAM